MPVYSLNCCKKNFVQPQKISYSVPDVTWKKYSEEKKKKNGFSDVQDFHLFQTGPWQRKLP